ncbi:MAG: flavin reductase family protein [Aestuariibacter sp.]
MCKTLIQTDEMQEYKSALAQFPTGVAVVTCWNDDMQPLGMTINSFSSISLTPMLVSWCLDRRANSYVDFCLSKRFYISLLAQHQEDIATKFATRGINKFADLLISDDNPIFIPESCAQFQCIVVNKIGLGDHMMLVGEVESFHWNDEDPLIYEQGKFTRSLNTTLKVA